MKQSITALLSQAFFVLGLGLIVYGVWLWSHPLSIVLCGLFTASTAFLIGYREVASENAR